MSWTSPLTVPIRNVPTCCDAGLGQQRAQDVERALHRAGGDQHLGHEVVAALEPRADLLERRDQRVVQHPLGLEARLQPLVDAVDDGRRVADQRLVVQRLQDLLVRSCGVFSLLAVAEAPAERPRLVDQDRLQLRGSAAGVIRSVGPVMLSAATTSPRAPRTGAAIAARPGSSSSIAVAILRSAGRP